MEALQMLKFAWKKECISFTKDLITTESEMTEDHSVEDGYLLDRFFDSQGGKIDMLTEADLTDDMVGRLGYCDINDEVEVRGR
jgi:hypothetical protein